MFSNALCSWPIPSILTGRTKKSVCSCVMTRWANRTLTDKQLITVCDVTESTCGGEREIWKSAWRKSHVALKTISKRRGDRSGCLDQKKQADWWSIDKVTAWRYQLISFELWPFFDNQWYQIKYQLVRQKGHWGERERGRLYTGVVEMMMGWRRRRVNRVSLASFRRVLCSEQ